MIISQLIRNLAYYHGLNQCASLSNHDHLNSLKNNTDTTTLRSIQAKQENLHYIISEVSNKLDILTPQKQKFAETKLKMHAIKIIASKAKLQIVPKQLAPSTTES